MGCCWNGQAPNGCGGARPTVALNTMLRNLDFNLQAVEGEGRAESWWTRVRPERRV